MAAIALLLARRSSASHLMPSGSENERRHSSSSRLPKLPDKSSDSVPITRRAMPSSMTSSHHGIRRSAIGGYTTQRPASPALQRRSSGSNIALRSRDQDSSKIWSVISRNDQATQAAQRSRHVASAAAATSSSSVGLLPSTDRTRHQLATPHQSLYHRTTRLAPSPVPSLSSCSSSQCHDDRLHLVGLRNLGNTVSTD